jgi:hypothetical protein
LDKGCELNKKHLKALNAWGGISVEISDDEMPADIVRIEISAQIATVIYEQLKVSFLQNNITEPFIKELVKEFVRFSFSD